MSRIHRKLVRREIPTTTEALGVPALLSRVYAARGIQSTNELDLSLSALIPPTSLLGADLAAERLHRAIDADEKILIVGDFDADGATSTALAMSALRDLGATQVSYLVPNRFEYGYGLTPEIVELAAQESPTLLITVDNGISSIDGVVAAQAHGIEVLITDHHLPGEVLPAAEIIVNPNQWDCEFPSKALAGVGVMFYVLMALRARLRSENWFVERGIDELNLAQYLDLVALGTVADVVPLDHNNRILVEGGLARMRAGRARPGIAALLSVAGKEVANVVATDLGFAAGPRLNAAGRLDDMSLGIECLLSTSETQARQLALQLDGMNRERRQIEHAMEQEALSAVDTIARNTAALPPAFILSDPNWHQGVVGILASRLKDRYQRPVIAFAHTGEGMLKGSGRGIAGLHLRDLLDRVATLNPGLVSKFGGHAMAAGLSLEADKFDVFAEAFTSAVIDVGGGEIEPLLYTDGELQSDEFALEIAQQLRTAGPWGQLFPEPLFDGVFDLVEQRIVGERHLKMRLRLAGLRETLDAIAFAVDTEFWPSREVDQVQVAYKLDVNEFRGRRSLQLLVEQLTPI